MCLKRSLGLLLLLVTTASPSWAESYGAARQIAERSAAQWNAAFARGALEDILALYSDNAMLLQPNGAVSRGT
jgi:ketosteroid isomerase-like protein